MDVIFSEEEMVRENSVSDMKLNGPVFNGYNNEVDPNQEFVDGIENFGEESEIWNKK